MRRAVTGVHGCASHLVTASTPRDRRVRAAIEFMAGHLAGPVSVAEVARHVSVSPAHLYRLFRSQPGEAPHHVLRLLRLAKGADLLRSEERRVGKECRSRWWPAQPSK